MATVLPFSRSAHSPHDDAARAYIASLKAGQKPEIRPELGEWSPLAAYLDVTFERSQGNVAVMEDTLTGLLRSKRFPGLAELLALPIEEPPTIEIVSDPGLMPPLPAHLHYPAGYSEQAGRWLFDEYVPYSRRVSPESFDQFHVGGGLWVLSMVAARRIKIPFSKKDYTPLMIVMCAEPGLYKKSTTAYPATQVMAAAGLGWLMGPKKITPQKLLTDMAGTLPKNFDDLEAAKQDYIKARLAMSGQRGWYLDEFGLFLESTTNRTSPMADFQEFLLQVDTCEDIYDNATQARGLEIIDKPYLALFGSMTPSSIHSAAKKGAKFWTNGFWSRFAVITAPGNTSINSPFTVGEVPVPYGLSNALRDWHHRLGVPSVEIRPLLDTKEQPTGRYELLRDPLPEVECSFGAGVYEAWVAYRTALRVIFTSWTYTDLNASYERLAVKAMRIAALFASLENNNVIELWHWARAQEIAESWRASLHELYRQVNTNVRETQSAQLENEILRQIAKFAERKNVGPSVTDLQNYMKRFSRKEIDEALKALVKAGVLEVERTSHTVRYNFLKIETTYSESLEQVQGYGGVR